MGRCRLLEESGIGTLVMVWGFKIEDSYIDEAGGNDQLYSIQLSYRAIKKRGLESTSYYR